MCGMYTLKLKARTQYIPLNSHNKSLTFLPPYRKPLTGITGREHLTIETEQCTRFRMLLGIYNFSNSSSR